jgi:hypothetical protein
VGGIGLPGDPCTAHSDCLSRVCADVGACALDCERASDCLLEQTCEKIDVHGSACAGGRYTALGTACEERAECLGSECVHADRGPSFCSRRCDDDELACPVGWLCQEVVGRDVCVPNRAGAAGGCATRRIAPEGGSRLNLAAMLAALASAFSFARVSARRVRVGASHRSC